MALDTCPFCGQDNQLVQFAKAWEIEALSVDSWLGGNSLYCSDSMNSIYLDEYKLVCDHCGAEWLGWGARMVTEENRLTQQNATIMPTRNLRDVHAAPANYEANDI